MFLPTVRDLLAKYERAMHKRDERLHCEVQELRKLRVTGPGTWTMPVGKTL